MSSEPIVSNGTLGGAESGRGDAAPGARLVAAAKDRGDGAAEVAGVGASTEVQPSDVVVIRLDKITVSDQHFGRAIPQEHVKQLAESFDVVGALNPLTVSPAGEGQFELVAGEGRFRAHQLRAQRGGPVDVLCRVVPLDGMMVRLASVEENLRVLPLSTSERDAAMKEAVDLRAAIRAEQDLLAATARKSPRPRHRPKSARSKAIEETSQGAGKSKRTVADAVKRAGLDEPAIEALSHRRISREQATRLADMPETQRAQELALMEGETQKETRARLRQNSDGGEQRIARRALVLLEELDQLVGASPCSTCGIWQQVLDALEVVQQRLTERLEANKEQDHVHED
jgi:ParB-like chromosome segregation protein Spo0J